MHRHPLVEPLRQWRRARAYNPQPLVLISAALPPQSDAVCGQLERGFGPCTAGPTAPGAAAPADDRPRTQMCGSDLNPPSDLPHQRQPTLRLMGPTLKLGVLPQLCHLHGRPWYDWASAHQSAQIVVRHRASAQLPAAWQDGQTWVEGSNPPWPCGSNAPSWTAGTETVPGTCPPELVL